ncbi:MAG: riboflavin synthase [Nitrosospira sp.]|nr:riboflavin synthase [Nitrosospira sp.]
MFTGIIEAVGEIKQVTSLGASSSGVAADGIRLDIAPGGLDLSDVKTGDSIAVNGVCLTVTTLRDGRFIVEVSRETLGCTQSLDRQGGRVNLEKALRLSDRLGGHLVSGHVDAIGEVVKLEPAGESYLLVIRAPGALLKYIAKKGSITVNGVSLTVNWVTADEFGVNLIPHTLAMTTLRDLECGAKVNLEVDMLARYVEQALSSAANYDKGLT